MRRGKAGLQHASCTVCVPCLNFWVLSHPILDSVLNSGLIPELIPCTSPHSHSPTPDLHTPDSIWTLCLPPELAKSLSLVSLDTLHAALLLHGLHLHPLSCHLVSHPTICSAPRPYSEAECNGGLGFMPISPRFFCAPCNAVKWRQFPMRDFTSLRIQMTLCVSIYTRLEFPSCESAGP